jgi:hypothetical protein
MKLKILSVISTALIASMGQANAVIYDVNVLHSTVDLSTGVLSQPRYANGFTTAVSPTSVTFVGSNTGYVTSAISSYLSFAGVLTDPMNYVSNNLGNLTAPLYQGLSKSKQTGFIHGISQYAPNNFGIPLDLVWSGKTFAFDIPYYELSYQYDYSWSTVDAFGYDTVWGTGLPNVSSTSQSGHVKIITNFNSTSTSVNILDSASYSGSSILSAIGINPTAYYNNSFTWAINTADNLGGPGVLTISNLSVDVTTRNQVLILTAVPEPETYAMLMAGLGLI